MQIYYLLKTTIKKHLAFFKSIIYFVLRASIRLRKLKIVERQANTRFRSFHGDLFDSKKNIETQPLYNLNIKAAFFPFCFFPSFSFHASLQLRCTFSWEHILILEKYDF